jgi:hypothetical protein
MSEQKQSVDKETSGFKQPTGPRKTPPPLPPGLGRKLDGWPPPQQWGPMLRYFILMVPMASCQGIAASKLVHEVYKDFVPEFERFVKVNDKIHVRL